MPPRLRRPASRGGTSPTSAASTMTSSTWTTSPSSCCASSSSTIPRCFPRATARRTFPPPLAVYEHICRRRGFLLRGGEFDYERGARAIVDDFRKGPHRPRHAGRVARRGERRRFCFRYPAKRRRFLSKCPAERRGGRAGRGRRGYGRGGADMKPRPPLSQKLIYEREIARPRRGVHCGGRRSRPRPARRAGRLRGGHPAAGGSLAHRGRRRQQKAEGGRARAAGGAHPRAGGLVRDL